MKFNDNKLTFDLFWSLTKTKRKLFQDQIIDLMPESTCFKGFLSIKVPENQLSIANSALLDYLKLNHLESEIEYLPKTSIFVSDDYSDATYMSKFEFEDFKGFIKYLLEKDIKVLNIHSEFSI